MNDATSKSSGDMPTLSGSNADLPRVAFVVGGDVDSAMGVRARAMATKLSEHYQIQIAYRSSHKLWSIATIFRTLVRFRPTTIYVFDISYTGVIAAGLYKFLFRKPLIIETGDAIVELVRSTGSRGLLGTWLTALLEKFAFRIADRVVVRGTLHKELLAQRGTAADVIQDGVNVESFSAGDATDLRKKFDLENVTTIGLVGSSIWSEKLQRCYGWEVVETLLLLKDRPVKGVMIGSGDGIAHLKERARAYELEDKIIFLGHVPYEQLPRYLRLIDICFSSQTNDVVGQVRTTGKLPLYLAAGRYILASRVGEAAMVLPEEMLVDYDGVTDLEYPQKLRERIERILEHPELLDRAQSNITLAREKFDYAVLSERMKQLIDAMIWSQTTSIEMSPVVITPRNIASTAHQTAAKTAHRTATTEQ